MTARSKTKRNKNTAIKRAKNKVKELKKLKKTLGLLDEDGMDLMEKIKDITEQQKREEELKLIEQEVKEEIYQRETRDLINHESFIEVVNPKTKVRHKYNAKTMVDQFGTCPVWYNKKKEDRKRKIKEGKISKPRKNHGRKMHFIDANCAWKNIA